jgi:transposase
VSVAPVARRYSMNANLIFKWLNYPRFAPHLVDIPKRLEDGVATFLPIEVSDPSPVELLRPSSGASLPSGVGVCAHRVDIIAADLLAGNRRGFT